MKIDKDNYVDALIDQALREYPLEPAPESLKAKIMGQIERPLAVKRFKISWMDLALSGAMAMLVGFVLDFFQDVARSPYWSTRFRIGLISFWQDARYFLVHNQTSLMAVLFSAAVVLSLLAILASVYWRYAVQTDRLPV
jgi:hypothetical protein